MGTQPVEGALGHSMRLEAGSLSSRQMIDSANRCHAGGLATGGAARRISRKGVHREVHAGMGLAKILSDLASEMGRSQP